MHIYTANWNWALTLLFLHSLCVVFSDRLIKNDPYPFFQNLICIWSRSVFMLRTLLGEDTSNWFYDSQLLSLQSFSLLACPPSSCPLSLLSFISSLSLPLFSSPSISLLPSPWPSFPPSLQFLVVWDRLLPWNLDLRLRRAQTGPRLPAILLRLPPGRWDHRCVQSHPDESFPLNYYL